MNNLPLFMLAIALTATIPARALDPITAKPGFTLTEAKIGPNAIPSLILLKEGADKTKIPAVILIHGGGIFDALHPGLPWKEEWFRPGYEDVPYRLAGKGMLVVAIDGAWAESRLTTEARELLKKNRMEALWTYYIKTVGDVSTVIDYLSTLPYVDSGRIAVAGKSGGALASLMAACQEPRLAAVVSWKGAANFLEMGRIRKQDALYAKAFAINPAFRDELQRVDPINCFEKIPPKALALINNTTDPAIPVVCAQQLYQKLRPLYEKNPDNLLIKLVDTNKPTHDDQVEAFEAGCDWLEIHLLHEQKQ